MKLRKEVIIFTDLESVDVLLKYKRDNHQIIIIEKEDWYVHKYLHKYELFHSTDHEKHYHTVELYMVWNEKSNFLIEAMKYTDNDYLLWVDIGCFRKAELMDNYLNWPNENKFKSLTNSNILLLQVGRFEVEELISVDQNKFPNFRLTNRIGGTIFGGFRDNLLKWHKIYYSVLESYFNLEVSNYEGKDQSIMAYIRLKYPDLVKVIFREEDWFYLQDYLL